MEDFIHEKLVTATTLTAGIGTALVGQAHHADAAEIIQITTTITTTRLKLQRLQQLRQLHHQFHILVTYTLQDNVLGMYMIK